MKRLRPLSLCLLLGLISIGGGGALRGQSGPATAAPDAPSVLVAPAATDDMSPAPSPAADEREGLRRLDQPAAIDDATPAVEATAHPAEASEPVEAPAAAEAAEASAPGADPIAVITAQVGHRRHQDNSRVNVFGNVLLAADEVAGEAVAILGDVVIDGHVDQQAVAVLGDVTINGDTGAEAVAVLGKATINGEVRGEVVSILGGVQIGPEAHIHGDVVSVGGSVKRAPGSRIDGSINEIPFLGGHDFNTEWLKQWVRKCLIMGRPLWFGEHLGWAWMLAGAALLLYALIALISPRGIEKCCRTMEAKPGLSIVTALLTVFILPLAMIVLSFTVIGAFVLGFLMFFISIFGKAVFLAWLGRRFTRTPDNLVPVVAVLLGGLVTTALYLVPFLGFIFMKLSGVLGTGIVVYTILLAMQSDRPKTRPSAPVAPAGPSVTPPTFPGAAASPEEPLPMNATETNVPPPLAPAAASTSTGAAAAPASAARMSARPPQIVQASSYPRAGFWVRIAATLLDMIVLGIVVNVAETGGFRPADYFPLVAAAYFVSLWALKGTTIGGIVLGLKVVRIDDRPVEWSVALIRALGAFLSLFVAGFGFIWVAFDDDRQSWHDKIAGTTIVRLPKGTPLI